MPASVHINENLALRVQHHTGRLGLAEFANLIRHYQSNPRVFCFDVIHFLDETSTFDFGVEEIPPLKAKFAGLIEAAKLPIVLRSVWVCPSPSAWNVLEAWLFERHSLDGLHTEASLVGTLDEARVLFDEDELNAVRTMRDFRPHFST